LGMNSKKSEGWSCGTLRWVSIKHAKNHSETRGVKGKSVRIDGSTKWLRQENTARRLRVERTKRKITPCTQK